MKKILTNIIIWVLKRNPEIKDNVINNFKGNQNIDVESFNKETIKLKKDIIEKEQNLINFKNVKPGDVVISKTVKWRGKKNKDHFYRPYFIVGRTNEKLYGLYCTTSTKVNDDINFYHYFNKSDVKNGGKVSHVDCRNIFVLNSSDFQNKSTTLDKKVGRRIIELLMQNSVEFQNIIDFNVFGFNPKVESIVSYNNEFYFIYNIDKNEKVYIARLKEYDKDDKGIIICGKYYVLDETKKEIIDKDSIDYVIYEQTKKFTRSISKLKLKKQNEVEKPCEENVAKEKVNNEENTRLGEISKLLKEEENMANEILELLSEQDVFNETSEITYADKESEKVNYEFGDVLSLKNSKNKIIYLTSLNKQIYYITEEQLEIYTGIRHMHESEANGIYRSLSDKEFSRLIEVLNKPLNSEKIKFVPSIAKNNIKNNISRKQLK